MGKRITRLYPESFDQHWSTLLEKPAVEIILRTGAVHHCRIVKKEASSLVIADFLFNKHTVNIQDIQEIQYDSQSAY